MDLQVLEDSSVAVVTVHGEFNANEAAQFRLTVEPKLGTDTRDFVIDLSRVDTISSAALDALLWLESTLQERLGQVRLAGCNDDVLTTLRITRLTDRLHRSETVEKARIDLR